MADEKQQIKFVWPYGVNIVVLMPCWSYVVIKGGSRNEEKGGSTLLLAGDSVHNAPSVESGGVLPQENFEILALCDGF